MQKNSSKPQLHGKSSTLDILGVAANRSKTPGVPHKWAEHHHRLTLLRDEFSGNRHACTEDARQELTTFGEHMADAATDSYDRDCSLALLSSAQSALYEIEQALDRIAQGTYGVCELTGKPIEPARLKALPWARYCLEAQQQLESHGKVPRVHLGELGSCMRGNDAVEEDPDELDTVIADRDKRSA